MPKQAECPRCGATAPPRLRRWNYHLFQFVPDVEFAECRKCGFTGPHYPEGGECLAAWGKAPHPYDKKVYIEKAQLNAAVRAYSAAQDRASLAAHEALSRAAILESLGVVGPSFWDFAVAWVLSNVAVGEEFSIPNRLIPAWYVQPLAIPVSSEVVRGMTNMLVRRRIAASVRKGPASDGTYRRLSDDLPELDPKLKRPKPLDCLQVVGHSEEDTE